MKNFGLFEQLFRAADISELRPYEFQAENKYTILLVEDELLLQFYEMMGLTHQQMLKSLYLGLFMNNHVIESFGDGRVVTGARGNYDYDPLEKTIDGIHYNNLGFFGNYSHHKFSDRITTWAFDGVLIPERFGNGDFNVERLKIDASDDDFIRVSVIDWTLVNYYVFTDSQDSISFKKIPEEYLDEVPEDGVDFGNVLEKMQVFGSKNLEARYSTIVIPSLMGEVPTLLTTWQNKTERLSWWFSSSKDFSGSTIIYSDSEDFLLVSNISAHPSVMTKNFAFYNSDGSTPDDFLYPNPGTSLENLVSLTIKFAKEYVENPQH